MAVTSSNSNNSQVRGEWVNNSQASVEATSVPAEFSRVSNHLVAGASSSSKVVNMRDTLAANSDTVASMVNKVPSQCRGVKAAVATAAVSRAMVTYRPR